jgi:hypothetical protein
MSTVYGNTTMMENEKEDRSAGVENQKINCA